MLNSPMYLQVILGYKLGYQRSNSLYHYCLMRKQSVSKLNTIKYYLSSM